MTNIVEAQVGLEKITSAELFFDSDPGNGNGTPITLDGNLASAIRTAIYSASPSLSTGLHSINVRMRDSANHWGPVFKTIISIENQKTFTGIISAALGRIYWDNDFGTQVGLLIINGNGANAINSFINASALQSFSASGLHKLNVQMIDPNLGGNYGPVFSTIVNFEDELQQDASLKVTEGRVWLDNDLAPSVGNMLAFDGNFSDAIESVMHTLPAVLPGLHTIHVQLRDSANGWGPEFKTVFIVENPIAYRNINVSEAQLYWDNDTLNNDTTFFAFDDALDVAIEAAFNTNITSLTAGLHTLYVRVRDVASNWSSPFKTIINIETPLGARGIKVIQGEVSIDDAPPLMVVGLNGSFTQALEEVQTTLLSSGLPTGLHLIHVRIKGLDNNWGPRFTTTLLVSPCFSTPVPTVTASRSLNFCIGDSVVLSANSGFQSYTWLRDNTVVGTGTSYVAKTSGSYRVIVTDITECPNSSPAYVVNVNNPTVTISSNSNFCQGTIDSLIATPGFSSYSWSAGSTTNKQIINSGGNYTITVTDYLGCIASASISVNQIAQPQTPIISASGPTAFCPGNSITLTSSATTNIVWNNGLTIPSFTTDTTGNYSVTVTGANGCTSTGYLNTFKFNAAVATISANGPLTFCANIPTTISANLSNTYSWSTGETNGSIIPSQTGLYSVSIIDSNGCSASTSIPITVRPIPSIPTINLSGPTSFCNGGNIILTSSSSINNIWSNGITTQAQTVYASAILVDTVFNEFGCKVWSTPINIDVHPVGSIQLSGPSVFCDGDSVTLTAYPNSGVNYLWQNGATTQSIKVKTNLTASVIVTEIVGGCSDTIQQSIIVNTLPTGSISASGPTTVCYNNSVTINTTGSLNTKFKWYYNGSPITYTIFSLQCNCYLTYYVYGYSYSATASGNYSAQAIDTLTGCTSFTNSVAVEIITPPKPIISSNGGTTLCIGANTLLTSTPAVSYLWSTLAISQTVVATNSGYYTVTITDVLGCTRQSDPTLITFYPTASISSSGSTTICNGDSVSLFAHPTGSYRWSNGNTTSTIPNLKAEGIYTVTVTDLNGCSSISPPVSITVNPLPSGSISAAGSTTICAGDNVVLNTVGSPNSIYLWYFNSSPILTQYYNQHVSGYSYAASMEGSYHAQIYDTLTGCYSFSNSIYVTVNPLPNAFITQTLPIKCYGSNDAEIIATASGTIGPYTYLWSTASALPLLQNVTAGNYSVQVMDANGCTKTASYTITQPTSVSPLISSPTNTRGFNISCFSGNDGSATVLSGGTSPYTYLWSNSNTNNSIANLTAGTYTVTVTDANNCIGTTSKLLTQPTAILLTLTPSQYIGGFNIRCKNENSGFIAAITAGGTGPFTYLWSDGSTLQTNDSLFAGTYSVVVTDSVGCSVTSSLSLTEPALLTTQLIPSIYTGYNISCNGESDGSIILNVAGGNLGYQYNWSDTSITKDRTGLVAGEYFVVVKDTNNCIRLDSITLIQPTAIINNVTGSTLNCYGDQNGTASVISSGGDGPYTYLWANNSTTNAAIGLTAGFHQITVTDSRGCSEVSSAEVQSPAELVGYAFGTYIECGTQIGLLSVTAAGGTGPYTFLWSNGSTSSFQTNLPVGSYSVTVTDSHGCMDNSYAIIVNPPTLYATISNDTVPCTNSTNGILTLNVSGGVTPYMYLWSNGQTTPTINGLSTGNYTVIVTDANGCTVVNTPSVFPEFIINNSFSIINGCNGASNSSITAAPSGGTSPYNYLWNNGATLVTNSGLPSGNYTVTVTDNNGCIAIADTTIENIIIEGPTAFCHGDSALLTINSGTTFLWNTGATSQSIYVKNDGIYTATVNGCSDSLTFFTEYTYCEETINVRVFIQGFYLPGTDSMVAVIDPLNFPSICDTLIVQLADSVTLEISSSDTSTITTHGYGEFYFEGLQPGHRYYIVVRHRNSIETWSKHSFLFKNPDMFIDFTRL